jgi:seryl-tRNA synthetase
MPNIPHESTPDGKNEHDNVVIRTVGEITSKNTVDHIDLTTKIDTDLAAKLAGSRFAVLKGSLAKLQRSLISLMLDTAHKNGYEEYYLPYMANKDSLIGTGNLPKFEEDLFKTSESLYLIPTAEVPLTNIYRDVLINSNELPIKLTAHTPCFRSEAGSYGRDTKGLIRQHQFEKIELFKISDPANSMIELEGLLENAEEILQLLDLPYQVVQLCAGDIGFSSCKTYDIEVWMPSQNKYREISSCSNFGDFQSRRSNIKFKSDTSKNYVHTINGSGLAVGRTLIALLENNYNGSDSIKLPKILHDYFGSSSLSL